MLVTLLAAPLVTALVCAIMPAGRAALVSLGGSMILLVAGGWIALEVAARSTVRALGGRLFVDGLSAVFLLGLVVIWAAVTLPTWSRSSIRRLTGAVEIWADWRFHVLMNLLVFGLLLVLTTDNLGVMWLGMELAVLVTGVLVAFAGTATSLQAAWKYLLVASVGVVFALFATLILSIASIGYVTDAARLDWTALRPVAERLDPPLMKLALVFAVIGYGTTAGFAPMHGWLSEFHRSAPVPVAMMVSGAMVNCALYGILKYYALTAASAGGAFASGLLGGVAVLSLVLASFLMVLRPGANRVLAYASVQHMGVAALGVAFGGVAGVLGGLLHTLNHTMAKGLLTLSTLEPWSSVDTPPGPPVRAAWTTEDVLLVAGGLALSGLPPFGTFFSGVTVLRAGIDAGRFGESAVLVVSLGMLVVGVAPRLFDVRARALGVRVGTTPGRRVLEVLPQILLACGLVAAGLAAPGVLRQLLVRAAEILS